MRKSMIAAVLVAGSFLGAAEYTLDVENLQTGDISPSLEDNALVFKAGDTTASAALIPTVFDLSRGADIELEFKADKTQTNTFPRILDNRDISIQLFDSEKEGRAVKLLLNGADKKYKQIIAKLPDQDDQWHKVSVTIDPAAKTARFQLDNTLPRRVEIPAGAQLDKVRFVLGSTALGKSTRGFSGAIRNVKITTP